MKIYCKNKHWSLNEDYNLDKVLYLLIDRPSYINTNNSFYWNNNEKQFHREYDLPATIWISGTIQWYKNSFFHRKRNKPTEIYSHGNHVNKFIK